MAKPSIGDFKKASLSEPALRQHDFATADHSAHPPDPTNAPGAHDDTDTESNSSDDFDWSEDEEEVAKADEKRVGKTKARRGRAVWLAFMKLARPLRIIMAQIIGAYLPCCRVERLDLLTHRVWYLDHPAPVSISTCTLPSIRVPDRGSVFSSCASRAIPPGLTCLHGLFGFLSYGQLGVRRA
jgi:hypothetical protein